jgi:hypothetical protein
MKLRFENARALGEFLDYLESMCECWNDLDEPHFLKLQNRSDLGKDVMTFYENWFLDFDETRLVTLYHPAEDIAESIQEAIKRARNYGYVTRLTDDGERASEDESDYNDAYYLKAQFEDAIKLVNQSNSPEEKERWIRHAEYMLKRAKEDKLENESQKV